MRWFTLLALCIFGAAAPLCAVASLQMAFCAGFTEDGLLRVDTFQAFILRASDCILVSTVALDSHLLETLRPLCSGPPNSVCSRIAEYLPRIPEYREEVCAALVFKTGRLVCFSGPIGVSSLLRRDRWIACGYTLEGGTIVPPGVCVVDEEMTALKVQPTDILHKLYPPVARPTYRDYSNALEYALSKFLDEVARTGNAVLGFSGGVDSLLLANAIKTCTRDDVSQRVSLVNLEYVGEGGGFVNVDSDSSAAHRCEPYLGLPVTYLALDGTALLDEVANITALIHPQEPSVMNINVSSVMYNTLKYCSPALYISGLGPDELLGGYSKFKTNGDPMTAWGRTVATVRNELDNLYARNCYREHRIATHFKTRLLTPLLHPRLVAVCLVLAERPFVPFQIKATNPDMDSAFKDPTDRGRTELFAEVDKAVDATELPRDKFIQRVYMLVHGVPASLAGREKRAAQFGSNAAKVYRSKKAQ